MTKFASFSEERRIRATLLAKTDTELHNIIVSSGNEALKDMAKRIIEARDFLNIKNPSQEEHATLG